MKFKSIWKSAWLWSLLCGVGAATILWVCLHHGVGLESDTVSYFRFPVTLVWRDLPVHHGPLYSVMLAVIRVMTRADVHTAAQWFNIVAYALFGALLYRVGLHRCSSRWTATCFMILVAASLPMLIAFSYAMSEPLFFVLLTAALGIWKPVVLEQHFGKWHLLLAFLLASVTLTRYVGVVYTPVFALALWLAADSKLLPKRNGLIKAVIVGAVALIPLAARLAWNHLNKGTATNREFSLNMIPYSNWSEGAISISSWLLPYQVLLRYEIIAFIVAGGVFVVSAFLTVLAWRRHRHFDLLCGLAVVAYALFFVLVSIFADLGAFNQRKLAPVFLFGIPLWWSGLRFFSNGRGSHVVRGILIAYFFLFTSYRAFHYIHNSYRDGIGFGSLEWREKAIMDRLETLTGEVSVYSNAADAYFLITGTSIRFIPRRFRSTNMRPLDNFESDYARLIKALVEEEAALWRSHLRYWPPYLAVLSDIISDANLIPVFESREGVIYAHVENKRVRSMLE